MVARVFPGLGTRDQKKLILGSPDLAENEIRVPPHAPCQCPHRCFFSASLEERNRGIVGFTRKTEEDTLEMGTPRMGNQMS